MLVPAAGGRAHVVARNADSAATWSRDGQRLLYTEYVRRPFSTSVRVLNVVTHTNTRIDDTSGIAHWLHIQNWMMFPDVSPLQV